MQPNPRASHASQDPRAPRFAGSTESDEAPAGADATDDDAAVTGLWCPHCKTPFVGAVDARDASFVHQQCGGRSVLDLAMLDALAGESWFWRRYRDRLRAQG